MTDTTTIEITDEQKQALDDLKQVPTESYKSVIARLLEGYSGAIDSDTTNGLNREALAEDRQGQLEEIVYAATGDVAQVEHIRELSDEIQKLREQVERAPGRTANELEDRFR